MNGNRWMVAMGILALSSFSYSSGAEIPKESPELLARGRATFAANCALCHGEKGEGNGMAASGLSPKPRNFTKDAFKNGSSPAEVFATISRGISGSPMPAFAQLSDEERWALAYFVRSLKKT